MMKNEYMKKLAAALDAFSEETKKEVLEDYESHFAMGMEDGRSEAEICEELGPVELFIEELAQMEPKRSDEKAQGVQETREQKPVQVCAGAGTSELRQGQSVEMPRALQAAADADSAYLREGHAAGCKTIVVEGLHADVSVDRSPDDQVHVYFEDSESERQRLKFRFYFRQEGNTVYTGIRKAKTVSSFWSNISLGGEVRIVVQIPGADTEVEEVRISTVSGEQEVNGIVAGKICLESVSGDIGINGDSCVIFTAKTKSGDIEAKNFFGARGTAETISGDISVDWHVQTSKVKTTSGDVDLKIQSAGTLEVSSVSGDLQVQVVGTLKTADISTVSGDVDLDVSKGITGQMIFWKTVSGDLKVRDRHFQQIGSGRSGRVERAKEIGGTACSETKISTVSGDITIS